MKVYQTNEIKNLTLVGNSGSGKTTFAEAMLFNGGIIGRRGEVENKNTVSDYHEIEHENGSSVFSTVLYSEWNNKKLNFIDAPGADSFIGHVYAAFHVTDTALLFLNARNGVEVGTEIVWRVVKEKKKPMVIVVNQLDHENANFEKTVDEAKNLFGKTVIMQYPVEAGLNFNAVIDILTMKMYKWGKDGGKMETLPIPASETNKAAELQSALMEASAEHDEELMEIFFDKGELTVDEMRKGMLLGIKNGAMYPILCASAKKNIGVDRIMEFISNVFPSPNNMPPMLTDEGVEVAPVASNPLSIFIFKTAVEPHLGEVNYFKVGSGTLNESADLVNSARGAKERLSQLYLVAGKTRTKVAQLLAGDIGATVKLKETKTNHTLAVKDADYKFAPIVFPEPKHRTAIKAVNEADDEKLGEVLHRMHDEDPTLILEYSKELKQLILHGQGEYHLNMLKWHLDNIFKIETNYVAPKIQYRETITKPSQAMYRHKKQSGGAGQFGEVHMIIEPHDPNKPEQNTFKVGGTVYTVNIRDKQSFDLKWGGKLEFYNCIVGGVIDARFLPAILKGINEKIEEGPLTGSYARDIRVYVYDGKMHPVDSNEISFKLAGAKAFSEAFKKASPKIMEPVCDVEVYVPSDRMGDVMKDIQGRRAVIMGMSSESGYEKLAVKVPLKEMQNYSTTLRALTNGRATYKMKVAEYAQVPGDIQEQLLKEYEASSSDED